MVNGIVILAAVALLFGGFARIREWRLRPKRSFLILLGTLLGLLDVFPFAELFSGSSGRMDAESA